MRFYKRKISIGLNFKPLQMQSEQDKADSLYLLFELGPELGPTCPCSWSCSQELGCHRQ